MLFFSRCAKGFTKDKQLDTQGKTVQFPGAASEKTAPATPAHLNQTTTKRTRTGDMQKNPPSQDSVARARKQATQNSNTTTTTQPTKPDPNVKIRCKTTTALALRFRSPLQHPHQHQHHLSSCPLYNSQAVWLMHRHSLSAIEARGLLWPLLP